MSAKPKSQKQLEAQARREDERETIRIRLLEEVRHDLYAKNAVCGDDLNLTCISCGTKKRASIKCKKRWCPVCAYYIAAERVAKYRDAASRFAWPLFVTLTVKNSTDSVGLVEIKKSFGKWRRRKLIRVKVKSGIVGFEVTNKGEGWHPHIHMLLDCQWLALHVPEPNRKDTAEEKARKCKAAAEELEQCWASCCGQKNASVRARRGDEKALVEVLKYSCKGSELAECAEEIAPLIDVMESMRLMTTFGAIRKEMKDEDLEEGEASGCQCEGCRAIGTMIPDTVIAFMMRK